MSDDEYLALSLSDDSWCCATCWREALPFHDCSTIHSTSSSDDFPPSAVLASPVSSSSQNSSFSIFYSNCRSLLPKLDLLRTSVLTSSPSVVALVETWLDSSISDLEIFIPGYSIIRLDRNRHGGGILFYIKNEITILSSFASPSIELLTVDLHLSKHSPLLCLYYRPPSSSLSDLNSFLLNTPIKRLKSFILLGDFNINLLPNSANTPLHQELSSLTDQLDLHQIVSEPTRCSNRSSSLIDLVFTSDPSAVTCSTLHPLWSSDHKSLSLALSWSVPSPHPVHRTIWRYS